MIKLKLELSEIDEKLLESLRDHTGFDDDTILRLALRFYHKKELPAYVMKIKKKELEADPEANCKAQGGVIEKDEQGRRVCKITKGGMTHTVLL